MESQIKDYKGEVINEFNNLVEIIEFIDKTVEFKNKIEEIKAQLKNATPKLMFFGIYNSGKSTLLNAIFGEYKASVADIPETHKITEYEWRNFKLVDTPGINGPEEDQRISLKAISNNDIIMFVIDDSDTFDSEEVAERVVDIIELKKPLIIVLNCKQETSEDINTDLRIISIKGKFNENIIKAYRLRKEEDIALITKKYDFLVINANTAYNAKLGNKELLIKRSRINELETAINTKLTSVSGVKMLNTPIINILSVIQEVNILIADSIAEKKSKGIMEKIMEISEKKMLCLESLQGKVRFEIRKNIEPITKAALNNNNIEPMLYNMEKELKQLIDNELKRLVDESVDSISNFVIQKNYEQILTPKNSSDEVNSSINSISGDTDSILDLAAIGGIGVSILTAVVPVTIPVKIITVIITGLVELINVEAKRKAEKEKIEEMNRIEREKIMATVNVMQEVRSKVNAFMFDIEDKTLLSVKQMVENIFGNLENQLKEALLNEDTMLEKFVKYASVLSNTQMNLDYLKTEFS